ncbi:MAG: SprT-like domain-containing protein [Bacteroidota bacterium]
MRIEMHPTTAQFEAFEDAYEYFNERLFDNELPPVILNLSRKSKAMGFVAPFRWRKTEDEAGKGTIHELSLNPEILSMSLVDVYSTLVHEQCHIWQYTHGKPSRNGYHNKEWASQMLWVGLIPSHTGKIGGRMTGQNMSDYPEEGGKFLKALKEMPDIYKLPFTSVEGDFRKSRSTLTGGLAGIPMLNIGGGSPMGSETPPKPKTSKNKYSCPCGNNVWGKLELNIICGDCEESYVLAD